ncbi:transcriptional regulator protein [Methanococcoides orientis]|uniref:transcriptional regulator protein n=1 Tax=Methanococcoides orientis TaxID=2822137 RepID=UPI001E5BF1DD|nr:transcriptional regulator protein [Methanococcoides orientis]UGV41355.1 transcriptional regulator protein [Methanococcoides orientis]
MISFGGKQLSESNEEIVESLKSLGMTRNLATTIAYLSNVKEASSQEIEMSTGLRQPEVSVAMREMRENSWISVHNEKVTGKGRPTKIYSLTTPFAKIIKHYEEKIREENEARMRIINKLKTLAK